jgi:hypothetical protein
MLNTLHIQICDTAPELDKDGGVGIHSNQKHSATAASKFGCTSEKVKIRGR